MVVIAEGGVDRLDLERAKLLQADLADQRNEAADDGAVAEVRRDGDARLRHVLQPLVQEALDGDA